jgi:hypothetical protein
MPDFFILCVVLVMAYFYAGLIYLLYIPLKLWLKRTNRLSLKLSIRINWLFILLPILYSSYLYFHKDDRESSKDRLEEIADVKLPQKFRVLKDEFQDMWQDYALFYDIEFTEKQAQEFISSIHKSRHYLTNTIRQNNNDSLQENSKDTVWTKTDKGYLFSTPSGRTNYNIYFDTIKNVLKYEEIND